MECRHLQSSKSKVISFRSIFQNRFACGLVDQSKVLVLCSPGSRSCYSCFWSLSTLTLTLKQMGLGLPAHNEVTIVFEWGFQEGLCEYHHITPHHTTSHYITPHYTTLRYIIPHYTTSHHITLHHITLHHITLHHTTAYHTTAYHTID
jgi:hypothetical protein